MLKKYCSVFGGSPDYRAIWESNRIPKIEWFCAYHSKTHGPAGLPFKLKLVR